MAYMPTECVKTVVAVRALIKSILAGSRPGGCFNCVLLELPGMALGRWSVEGCRVASA
jgi:hypothetical protein